MPHLTVNRKARDAIKQNLHCHNEVYLNDDDEF